MDWVEIAAIAVTIVAIVLGGKLKKLAKEIKELFATIEDALEDEDISPEEIKSIIKEANDVKTAILEIALLIAKTR
uniref:Uncharacterized protein n=1 Tax=viral metagenome TaxID=1070528 RepID=A0A6M3JLC5_9ZZZZ